MPFLGASSPADAVATRGGKRLAALFESTEAHSASHGEQGFTKRLALALAILLAMSIVAVVVGLLANPPPPGSVEENPAQELGGGTGWTSLGIAIGVVFIGWAYTGVRIFRPLPGVLRRNRIEIHNWVSILALGFALFHALELMSMGDFRGWLSGWVATLLMAFLFVHGWWKRFWVGVWGLPMWRLLHWEGAIGVLAFSVMHWLLIERAKELAGLH